MIDDLIEQKAIEQMSKPSFMPRIRMSNETATDIIHALKHKGFHLVVLDARLYEKWILQAEKRTPAAKQKISTKQEREAKRIAGVKARAKKRQKK